MCQQEDTIRILVPHLRSEARFAEADIDRCIAPLVQVLNTTGLYTTASCCGHGKQPGRIDLRDGRVLVILPDHDSATAVSKLFPPVS